MINQAMVLAAGEGKRLRPLTEHIPKPLIPIKGKAIIDHVFDHLIKAGTTHCVVNTHYLAPQIQAHLQRKTSLEIIISHEPELLDTGGGIVKALPYFHGKPFFVVNADIWWRDQEESCLNRLNRLWDASKMDALLLLIPCEKALGYTGAGDYFLSADGKAHYRVDQPTAPTVFSGIRILHPCLLEKQEIHPFSIVPFFHEAEKKGRLYGVLHEGLWGDIGTIDSLKMIRAFV